MGYIGSGPTRFNTADDLTVTGDITVSGNVDGRDVASDGSKLDGIASSADNYSSWTISDGLNSEAIGSGNTLTIAGGGDTTASYSAASNTLTVTTNAPEAFASGTLMLFQQTAAPTGWTKQTTHNNKALRVVTGTASSGGSSAFTTAFGTPSVSGTVGISGAPDAGNLAVSISGNISSTTLSTSQIPSHLHNSRGEGGVGGNTTGVVGQPGRSTNNNFTTNNTGGGGSHNHGHNLSGTQTGDPGIGNLAGSLSSATASINVQYVDLIIASKD